MKASAKDVKLAMQTIVDVLEMKARYEAEIAALKAELAKHQAAEDKFAISLRLQEYCRSLEAKVAYADGLKAARIAYAMEFPLDKDGEPDLDNIHANIRALKDKVAYLQPLADAELESQRHLEMVFAADRARVAEKQAKVDACTVDPRCTKIQCECDPGWWYTKGKKTGD